MPLFQYRALQSDGAVAEGRLEAGGRQEVMRQLEGRGLSPIGLTETVLAGEKRGIRFEWGKKKVAFRALEGSTRELANLLAAGVPLSRSLQILFRESASPAARDQWKEVHNLVIDGASLADAMAQSPETFPRVYVAMVQAGEAGGFLDLVLRQIADFQTREKELRSKVISALIYPALLTVLAVSVLVFLLIFFIPRFQMIFEGFGAALPALTRAIVAASEWLRQYGPYMVIVLVTAFFAARQWLRSEQGRRAWQQFVLRIPLVGPLNARFAMTRFCRMLGTLIGAGVPLINALRVARQSIGNQALVDAVSESIERVKQGDTLATSLSNCPELFPGSVLEMIGIAEETGRLDEELVRLATTTDGDLDRQLRTAVSLAEPLMLMVMAVFIGTIIVGMVLPIFTIQEYIK